MLRCYTEESYDWEENLPLVLLIYRTTKHVTTGISPFQIMFGRDPTSMTHLEPLRGLLTVGVRTLFTSEISFFEGVC